MRPTGGGAALPVVIGRSPFDPPLPPNPAAVLVITKLGQLNGHCPLRSLDRLPCQLRRGNQTLTIAFFGIPLAAATSALFSVLHGDGSGNCAGADVLPDGRLSVGVLADIKIDVDATVRAKISGHPWLLVHRSVKCASCAQPYSMPLIDGDSSI